MSTDKNNQPLDYNSFGIAIICALSLEASPMIALFDEVWEHRRRLVKAQGDTNNYTIGRVGQHHVVLVHLPYISKTSAASAAASLRSTFPRIRLGLLVGVCGGVPWADGREIILGDVLISDQIVQTDFGRQYPDGFVRKTGLRDNHGRPNPEISGFLSKLQSQEARFKLRTEIQKNLDTLYTSGNFDDSKYPGAFRDQLFDSSYPHKHHNDKACTVCAQCESPKDGVCENALYLSCNELGCDTKKSVSRLRITERCGNDPSKSYYPPEIHFGTLSSADQVTKDAVHRNLIAQQANVIGFEMEGAGIWDNIPTIVIKGVCDYADSHKNKIWQRYAAGIAAACAKGVATAWTATTELAQESHRQETPAPPQARHKFTGNFFSGKNNYAGANFNQIQGPMYL